MLAFSLPTVNISPEPLTVSVVPASVLWSPAILSGAIFPATTWFVRILVSVALSARTLFRVSAGILANASLVGAKTVMAGAEFSVSTRPAALTAVTSVESTGLLLAAVATGSVAIPLNEPLPSFGTAEQATPKGWLIASVVVELLEAVVEAELLVDGAAAAAAGGVLVEPHAASPIGSAAARATKTVARRAVLVRAFMMCSCFPAGLWCCCLHEVFGAWHEPDWLDAIGFSSRDDDDDLLDAARPVGERRRPLVGLHRAGEVGRADREGVLASRRVPWHE